MKLIIAGHVLAASALVIASVMTIRLIGVLPSWFGIMLGLLLYGLTLWLAKSEAEDETL